MKKYKTALVLGLGASGTAAARLLLREGTTVTAIDRADNKFLRHTAAALKTLGANAVLACKALPRLKSEAFDVCITSPGIPANSTWIRTVESHDVEVISELELGASRCKCPMLAVTGSKGKSTLVKLCAESIAEAGLRAAMAGNYGTPLSEMAACSGELDWIVVEASSFQLEKVKDFKPRVGVLLNLQPDHLDRHGGMNAYAKIKAGIFARMDRFDTGIIMDEASKRVFALAKGENRWATFGRSGAADYRYSNGVVRFKENGRMRGLSVQGTMFENDILGTAVAAAVAAIRACGLKAEAVERAAAKFKPLPHRLSEVANVNGIRFINDSKATSLTALCAGVQMCEGPVRLIAGGLLKERNLDIAKKVLEKRVESIYLIGKASKLMEKAWRNVVSCRQCGNLGTAVRSAFKDSSPGDIILLSPGCASFDQFKNFEDRGDKFTKIARFINDEEN